MNRLTADEVRARAQAERPEGACLICALLKGAAGPVHRLHQTEHSVVILSRYPRTWGQAMVLVRDHVTTFGDADPEAWHDASRLAFELARRIETHLRPLRCYVSCLGTAHGDLVLSSAHLHLNLDPVYDPDDRPRTILTFQHGAIDASEEELAALADQLRW